MSKHSPGPWYASIDTEYGDHTVWGPGSNDDFLANIGNGVDPKDAGGEIIAFDVSAANARLIAAAPTGHDLLVEIAEALRAGADFQLGPKGRHAGLKARLDAYFKAVEGA